MEENFKALMKVYYIQVLQKEFLTFALMFAARIILMLHLQKSKNYLACETVAEILIAGTCTSKLISDEII